MGIRQPCMKWDHCSLEPESAKQEYLNKQVIRPVISGAEYFPYIGNIQGFGFPVDKGNSQKN